MNALPQHSRRRISIRFHLTAVLTLLLGIIITAGAHPSGVPGGSGTDEPTPMKVDSLHPCIMVNDADLGTIAPGRQVTTRLHICNSGQGQISFTSPYATVTGTEFSIAPADLITLQNTKLGPNQCVDLPITFTSNATGSYRGAVRVWASTRECRDTAVVSVVVGKPGPTIGGHDWGSQWVTTLNPCTRDTTPSYKATVFALDTGGINVTIARVELVGKDADDGYFSLDTSGTAIHAGDIIRGGDTTLNRLPQIVIFKPKDEREYSCKIRLITAGTPPDTVVATLHGIGIETHLKTMPLTFDTVTFAAPGGVTVNRQVVLTIPPTRSLTITQLTVGGPDAAEFTIGSGLTLPITTQVGSTLTIPIDFTPKTGGTKSSWVLITGDQSKCDDSLIALSAVAVAKAKVVAPEEEALRDARIEPNPFSATTTVHVTLPAATHATVAIYDAAGHRVATLADGYLEPGEHRFTWEAGAVPSGVYYCRIETGEWRSSRPLMLVR